ncbi:flagellar biosynthesis protein FlgB [Sphingomonas sp. ABOLE]|nr:MULTISPECIES: flagellar basal body protein [unclassified Sphingomonas]RSV35820.1 flagellar biosynthesis protein FlgB [Sphingomonas sp. ABOLE]
MRRRILQVSEPPLLNAIDASLRNLSLRQRVIAGNIANSETPGYKARDVNAPDFAKLLESTLSPRNGPQIARPQVAITASMAALGARPPQLSNEIVLDRDTSETKPDGNNVTLEDQLLKMGNIQAEFSTVAGISRKLDSYMKTALGTKRG